MAQIISREIGAPRALAQGWQAGLGTRHLKELIRTCEAFTWQRSKGTTLITHEPIGVVALITPWNWPINQIVCKVAPAIAAGCTMVLKPSEVSPLNALLFAEILDAAGVSPGVFNLVNGDGPTVGAALCSHPDVDMVSFTGSTRAGIQIATLAAPTVKRVHQELGGKSANLILVDADLDAAVTAGVNACFGNSGQSCNAPTRMFVPAARHERNEWLKKACELGAGCQNFVALVRTRFAETGHEEALQYGRCSEAAAIAHLGHTGRRIARVLQVLKNHIHLAHGFFHFPQPFGVRFEKQRVAAGEVNRVFAVRRKATASRQEMHDFRLLHRAPIRSCRAFENTGIDRFAAFDHALYARDFDRRRVGQTGGAPILEILQADALLDLLNLHVDLIDSLFAKRDVRPRYPALLFARSCPSAQPSRPDAIAEAMASPACSCRKACGSARHSTSRSGFLLRGKFPDPCKARQSGNPYSAPRPVASRVQRAWSAAGGSASHWASPHF